MLGNAKVKGSPVKAIDITENDNVVVPKPEETMEIDLSGGSPAPLSAPNLKDITLERLKKVSVYSSELSELQQPFSSGEKALDSLQTLLDESTVESSEVPENILNWLAMFIEGRHEPLSSLQFLLHEKLQQRWSSLALRSAVLRVAQRKSFGSKPAKSIDANENDAACYRWRWEAVDLKHFPVGAVRESVKRQRQIEKKTRDLCLAFSKFLSLASTEPVDETGLEKADDDVIRQLSGRERLLQAMEKRQQKLKEKEQQKKEKLQAQQQKTTTKLVKSKKRDMTKERNMMSNWVKAKKVKNEPRPTMCGVFLPWQTPVGYQMANIFPSPRVDQDKLESSFFISAPASTLKAALKGLISRRKPKRLTRHKLFFFHHEHRPAFFGIFDQRSSVLKSRTPFTKDPQLNYENDSDDEWESDISDAEDVCASDSDDGEELEEGDRGDGLVEDGWLQPEEMDADAREQLEQLGGELDFHSIGPIRNLALFNGDDDDARDQGVLEILRPFRAIVIEDTLMNVKRAIESPLRTPLARTAATKKTSTKKSDGRNPKKRKLFSPSASGRKQNIKTMLQQLSESTD